MYVKITLPDLGTDAGQPIHLSVWFADKGEFIYEGDRLVEVLVAGATLDVPAPATGRLAQLRAVADDPLQPGQVLGWIEVDEQGLR